MLIKKLPIAELKPADYNPRKDLRPGDPDYKKLKRSLTEFGYVEPVIYNATTGNIVGGHQRLKVLADLGHTEVDCVVVELDETREKALNVALNKISGAWDESKLALLIADLDASDLDAELTGFDDDEIAQLISSLDEDEVVDDGFDLTAALKTTSFVQRGDVWTVGKHRLVCGDATSATDVETLMEGKSANLVLTDPPYNVAFESFDGLKIKGDKQTDSAFFEFLLAAFTNMDAALDKGGSAYVFHADTEVLNSRKAFIKAGFKHDAVALVRQGAMQRLVERDLGVSKSAVSKWVANADRSDAGLPATQDVIAAEDAQIRELIRRNRLLEKENEVLRRAAAYL